MSDTLETLTGYKSTRRQLLVLLSLSAGSIAALLAAVPLVGFLFGPLLRKYPPIWRDVGRIEQFKIGDTVEVSFKDSSPLQWGGEAAYAAAWLRRNDPTSFTAYSVLCTHLGCPVRWIPDAELFMCPCHGGVYFKNGDVAAGPPPDPLQQYPVRVQNGIVQVEWKVLPKVPATLSDCGGCGQSKVRA